MSLLAGSYEKFIWGFRVKHHRQSSADETLTLTQLFSYPAHLSPVKSVAVAGPIAASAASDDSVKLYDLSTCSELGSLLHHTSSVTSLSFFSPLSSPSSFPRNLLSASDDGSLSIYETDPFVLLKTVKVHRKGVNDLAVHPSGRLALTVGRDSCFGMVNLVRGRRSFCGRLGKEANIVRFSFGGERFYMVMDDKVTVHEAADAKLVWEFEAQKRILCAAAGENGLLYTGGEDRGITIWDTRSGKYVHCIEDAHSSRVKGIVVLSKDNDAGAADYPYLVASASSDGVIRVWDVRVANKEKPIPLAEAQTKSRLTCLAGSSLKDFRSRQVHTNSEQTEQLGTMED